jgi:hypothetical protein
MTVCVSRTGVYAFYLEKKGVMSHRLERQNIRRWPKKGVDERTVDPEDPCTSTKAVHARRQPCHWASLPTSSSNSPPPILTSLSSILHRL